MPTTTWWNLESDKRSQIITRALAEFASASYEDASLSAIVTDLGIAKGSMYQYFADKYELYAFVLHYAHEQLRNEILQRMPVDVYQHGDLFAILHSYFAALRDIHQLQPDLLHCIARSTRTADPINTLAQTLMGRYQDSYLDTLVTTAQQNRSIRSDIDHHVVIYVVQLLRNDIMFSDTLPPASHFTQVVQLLDQGLRYRIR